MIRLPRLSHLIALTDDVGVIQHAHLDVPNRNTGYCTDDVARAFMVAVDATRHPALAPDGARLAHVYLSFLIDAQLPGGCFRNFMGYDRNWLDVLHGSADSNGRAIWALGYGSRHAPKASWRTLCRERVDRWLPNLAGLSPLRPHAYAALGLSHVLAVAPADVPVRRALESCAETLVAHFKRNRGDGWEWFEDVLTYDNARLCEGLLRAGEALKRTEAIEIGLRALDFLERVTLESETFVPIGSDGWYARGSERSRFAQQPLEAAAMAQAEAFAYTLTGDFRRFRMARNAHEWFEGRNALGQNMVEEGGCYDGLGAFGPNPNMGAESTLAYLSSALTLAEIAGEDAADIGLVAR
jgi:hypothetical protein